MISPRPTGGRSTPGAGVPGAGGGAPAEGPNWPVLARLPDLASQLPVVSSPSPLADGDLFTRQDLGDGGGIVPLVDTLETDDLAELADLAETLSHELTAPVSDPARMPERRPASARPARMTDQAAAPTRRLADQQRRVDRVVASMNAFERTVRPTPAPTMADFAYRIYASAAPHAAVAMVLALVLSAGLLYWIAFGRAGAGDEPILFDAPTKWSIESSGSSVAPAQQKPQPRTEVAPREIRVASRPEAPTASSPKLPPATVVKAETKPMALVAQQSVEGKPTVVATPAAAAGPTLTPASGAGAYPRTDYPNFDFPAYVAEQPSVEEQH